jgi:hypothetical protein
MEHLMLTAFTNAQQTQIEALRADLTRRIQRTVTVEYGEDDHGGLWAALNVETLPSGTWGRPGTLVSILAGAGVNGEATVVAADFSTVTSGVSMLEATKAATFAGVRAYRALTH